MKSGRKFKPKRINISMLTVENSSTLNVGTGIRTEAAEEQRMIAVCGRKFVDDWLRFMDRSRVHWT